MRIIKLKEENNNNINILDEDLRTEIELQYDSLAKLIKSIDANASVKVVNGSNILITTDPVHMTNIALVLKGNKEDFWQTSNNTIMINRKL